MGVLSASCDDLNDFFPDAIDGSSDSFDVDMGSSYTYVEYRNGVISNGTEVSLAAIVTYSSMDDAQSDTNGNVGEFSFTMMRTDREFDSDEIEELYTNFEALLDIVGSTTEEENCGQSSNLSSNQDSGSSVMMVSVSLLALTFALL